ncbi:hypothetical protein SynA1825c_01353 [Synechococcus sp. A18-25c]|uniref:hypothetical protein n=1 Tax=unclassified Synechococcus TaxID=2626047 RepID=UPI0016451BC5|nr:MULTISPECIES: hypothetical protein [unclassified Synechococcus]QNI48029.1 hypothetical protein SynA1560_01370 [Synechococcus sp. A15-60]QNJ19659.1 hypothetical protein SynA1825c_01353 [Synechococcus sp. A18-25c]
MENSFSRELARSLAVMLLEMHAELEEFAFQMDRAPQVIPTGSTFAVESQAQA